MAHVFVADKAVVDSVFSCPVMGRTLCKPLSGAVAPLTLSYLQKLTDASCVTKANTPKKDSFTLRSSPHSKAIVLDRHNGQQSSTVDPPRGTRAA